MDTIQTVQPTAEVIKFPSVDRRAQRLSARPGAALTERTVAALTYSRTDGQPQFTWDPKLVGLGVRLTPAGAKSYVLRYRVHGRQRLATFGDPQVHELDAVRKKAKLWLAQADNGVDPQIALEYSKSIGTLNEAWACYLDERITHRCKRSQVELRRMWQLHVQRAFGAIPVVDLTQGQIEGWHKALTASSGPYAANHAYEALRATINWQIKRHRHTLPPGFINPCFGVETNPKIARHVILRPAELPRLARAIDSYSDAIARAFFWLALYTGARKSELLDLTWDRVNLETREVLFGKTKNGLPHSVPLSTDAIRLLKALPRYEGNPYVLPARYGDRQRVNVSKAWRQIRAAAGLPHLRIHDLRRSVGSWLGAKGHTADMVGALLNHKSDITSQVYIQLAELDVKRTLVNSNAAVLRAALRTKRRSKPCG